MRKNCSSRVSQSRSPNPKNPAVITDLSITAFLSTYLHLPRYAWFIPFWTLMIEISLGIGIWDLELET